MNTQCLLIIMYTPKLMCEIKPLYIMCEIKPLIRSYYNLSVNITIIILFSHHALYDNLFILLYIIHDINVMYVYTL